MANLKLQNIYDIYIYIYISIGVTVDLIVRVFPEVCVYQYKKEACEFNIFQNGLSV